MKNKAALSFFILLLLAFSVQKTQAQNPVNWTEKQLMEPSTLAQILKEGKEKPYIFSVGPGALIPNSIAIGMTNEEANVAKLKKQLAGLPKDADVIIYCGCCPFAHCPNVRPAIDVLKQMQFTHYKLLNLSTNLKTDWIDKGYPTIKK